MKLQEGNLASDKSGSLTGSEATPRLVKTRYGKWLALTSRDTTLRIGVIGDTEVDARERFTASLNRALKLLTENPMDQITLPAGTIIHHLGMPFTLRQDTIVDGRAENLGLACHDAKHPVGPQVEAGAK